jgi:hypothetical protein
MRPYALRHLPSLVALIVMLATGLSGAAPQAVEPGQEPTVVFPPPVNAQRITRQVKAAEGATLSLDSGLQVTIPPNSLSSDATVTLTDLGPRAVHVGDRDMVPIGAAASLNLGSARMAGPLGIRAPRPSGEKVKNLSLRAISLGVALPTRKEDSKDPSIAQATIPADKKFSDVSIMTIGFLASAGYLGHVPWEPWPSYNLYVYKLLPNGKYGFAKFVDQGNVLAGFDLGARPLMLVHGLGGSVRDGELNKMAEYMRVNANFTAIVGFEYDTLSSIAETARRCRSAIALLNAPPFRPARSPLRPWSQIAHSMGTLITRAAFEAPGAPRLPIASARVALVCSPSLGTPIADRQEKMQSFVKYMVLNNNTNWVNANGQECKVTGKEPGFVDMRLHSPFIERLNKNVAHMQATYYALAGGKRLTRTQALDIIAGVYVTDGLVNLDSATTPLMKFKGFLVLKNDDHFTSITDEKVSFPAILEFLGPVPPASVP